MKDSIAPIIEQNQKWQNNISPIVEQQANIQALASSVIPAAELDPLYEVRQIASDNKILSGIGEIALKLTFADYEFVNPTLKYWDNIGTKVLSSIATGFNALINNEIISLIGSTTSKLQSWLQTIDFTPLAKIIEGIAELGFEYDYKSTNKIFLNAMFDAKWFPYAGWAADLTMVDELLEILDTSRASQNRIKRIDKLVFSYYGKEEINNIKRGWKQLDLPSYMVRILVQSIQAYHRREYALTVSALLTLWEGIIQDKMNDPSFRKSKKTRENLAKLIKENEFDEIFSSFCDQFIFYNCIKPEEVKPDVPGRHGIAHGWYESYPNRKMALNAILFTDFLLRLKPLDNSNG